jgi:hypothetical protein
VFLDAGLALDSSPGEPGEDRHTHAEAEQQQGRGQPQRWLQRKVEGLEGDPAGGEGQCGPNPCEEGRSFARVNRASGSLPTP